MNLNQNEVHLWEFNLDQHDSLFFTFLDAGEQERAARFATPELQNRFVVAHAVTRKILSPYLSCSPEDILFTKNAFGKPMLASASLEFNLSHTGNCAVLAIANRPVGVDIEFVSRSVDVLELAQRFFAEEEYQALLRHSPEEQKLLFFRIWTRKEALIKAIGKGLSQNLNSFVVSTEAYPDNALLHIKSDAGISGDWFIRSLLLFSKCVSAIAIAERAPHVFVIPFHADKSC